MYRFPSFVKNRLFQHVLFWLAHVVFYALLYGSFDDSYGQAFAEEIIFLPVKVLFTYFVLYFLLPRFILKGQYVSFAVIFLFSSFVAGLAQRFVAYQIDFPLFYPQYLKDPFFFFPKIIKTFVGIYPVVFTAVTIKLLKYWYADKQAQQILTKEKLEAELKFLKTQIHPHFLFNTLNNLYALTLKKSEKAPEMVLKLSELINYMLYECTADEVPLRKEIKFIQNYIAIEKMRYGDKLEVDVRMTGDQLDSKIAPMVILPFVENCFKHGVSEELQQAWVTVQLEVSTDLIIIKVENSKVPGMANHHGTGIGIQNVKRRLALLYPGRHELKILDGEETFLVILSIHQDTGIASTP
jgi:two-component system, LytTR family, sensor kinase